MPASTLARAMAAAGERAPDGTHVLQFDEIRQYAG